MYELLYQLRVYNTQVFNTNKHLSPFMDRFEVIIVLFALGLCVLLFIYRCTMYDLEHVVMQTI